MKVIASLVERGVWTYLQALATILLAGSVITGDLATAAAVAAIPAGLTVVTAGLPTSIDGVPFAVDAVYRTAREVQRLVQAAATDAYRQIQVGG